MIGALIRAAEGRLREFEVPKGSAAEAKTGASKGRGFDLFTFLAAVFFLLAVALAAVPALRAGPATLAGVLLVAGLAGVTFIALAALRGANRPVGSLQDGDLGAILSGLTEASAVCGADGAILETNGGWRRDVGGAARLPRTSGELFAALSRALSGEATVSAMRVGGENRQVCVTAVGGSRLLLRLANPAAAAAPAPPPPAPEPAAPAEARTPPGLDPFAAASPFGAALLEGSDPFAGVIVEANPALAGIAGKGAIKGAVFADAIAPAAREEAAASHAQGRPGPFEVVLADGVRTAHLYLAPAGRRWVVYVLDVTDQKRMQVQLAQRNKMEAIGQLAGGVSHDFNNLLTAMGMRVDELLVRHSLGDPSYDSLSEIKATANRAANLVRQLLLFSRKATIQRETIDLGDLIGNVEVLLRRLLREDVGLTTEYGRNLPQIRADKAQIENAIMNLVLNARDAVHANGGGSVMLSSARVTSAEAVELGYTGPAAGDMALIEVSDDGPGIAPEVIGNIFEPFFTTKAVGEGTGLGLATVYGIVKQSEGWITVSSKLGEGATFRIFLPVHVTPLVVEAPARASKARVSARDLSGAGRILFVEDEESVRGIAARLLRARGYEVIEAADGEEALFLAEKHAGAIDLMISDVIMPGIDGPTLLRKARPFLGAAPVMFISGYAEAEFSELLEGESGVSFLAKPIDIKTLSEKVKQQLQAA